MATKNGEIVDLYNGDLIELYEAWSLADTYSFNLFCVYFLQLDIPLITDERLRGNTIY